MPDSAKVAKYKAKGVCIDCGCRPMAPYRRRCGVCLEKQRGQVERHKARRLTYLNEKRCTMCGRPLDEEADAGKRLCINCREYAGRGRRV